MKKLKVMTIVGTRPELIKLSRILHELDQNFEHVFVHTGQNFDYELNEIFFKDLEIRKPDHFLSAAGNSTAETISNVILKADQLFEKTAPDALLIYGDTNSCLAVIPAKRRRIPIFHMEAGNRSFDQRVPEELNRKIVDHLSDINLPLTEHARRYLLAEGLRPETVIKSGSTMREVLTHYKPGIDRSDVLKRLALTAGGYFVVSAHREENIDSPERFRFLIEALNGLAERYKKPLIVSTHPRTRKRLEEAGEVHLDPLIQWLKPLGFFDYVHLQQKAFCVVSDSGTITEESSILNFPAVTPREAHERPEGMDEGTVVLCSSLQPEKLFRAVDLAIRQSPAPARDFRLISDFETENVSKKMVRIILSYTDYVNRTVWHKQI